MKSLGQRAPARGFLIPFHFYYGREAEEEKEAEEEEEEGRASFLSPPGAGDNIVVTRIVSPTRGIDSMETPSPTTKDDSVFPLRRGEGR